MGKSSLPRGSAYDETHHQYPEFGLMLEWLHPRRARKKSSSSTAAAGKLGILAATLAAGIGLALSMRVHSSLKNVFPNAATVRVVIEMENGQDDAPAVEYELVTLDENGNQIIVRQGELSGSDVLLELDKLEPGTRYILRYYITDEDGNRKQVGRYEFRTLKKDEGGKSGQGDQQPGQQNATPVPRQTPVPSATPTPTPTPTLTPPLLEIRTESLADATELQGYSAGISIENGTGLAPVFTIGGCPSGMSANGNTISGTPVYGTAGTYSITVTVTAGTASASKTLSLRVNPATLVITNGNLGEYEQGGTVSGAIRTNFMPAGLRYSASGPFTTSYNAATGAFSVAIDSDAAVGEYHISLSAAGGGYSASKTITFTVKEKVRPPKPVPSPEARDLEIQYFDVMSPYVTSGMPLSGKLEFRLKVNQAEDVEAYLSTNLDTPTPSYFVLPPASYAADGTVTCITDTYNFNTYGAHNMILTVTYTLDGVPDEQIAKIEFARSEFSAGGVGIGDTTVRATAYLNGAYLDLRDKGMIFGGAELPYTSLEIAGTTYTFSRTDYDPLGGATGELFYYPYRLTRTHPHPGTPGVLRMGMGWIMIPAPP